MEKINDTGFIPDLREISFQGRLMYYKPCTLMMGIFEGVGISVFVLESHLKFDEVLIHFKGSGSSSRFNGLYIAYLDQFRNSLKKFANNSHDVQRFVSFKDMKKLED